MIFGEGSFGSFSGTADLTMQPATMEASGRQDVDDPNSQVGTLSSTLAVGTPSSPTSAGETWSYWKGHRGTVFTARGRSTLSPAVCTGVAQCWPSWADEEQDERALLMLLEKFYDVDVDNGDNNNQTGKDTNE